MSPWGVIKSEFAFWDVDNTLVLHDTKRYKKLKKIKIKDPFNRSLVHKVAIHPKHVYWLKIFAARHMKNVVWSAGGQEWAQAVVHALKLDKYVYICIAKPSGALYDDDPRVFYAIPRWEAP